MAFSFWNIKERKKRYGQKNDIKDILKLINNYYSYSFFEVSKDMVQDGYESKGVDYLGFFKKILPNDVKTNVTLELNWLGDLTKTITADYIFDSGINYLMIFLDKNLSKEGRLNKINKFLIVHKNQCW
ncbi:MAG: hypothetical protein GX794_03710 [Acholeplasmataceae bacterium]|jgi:hypothetical protein|nr:hypothetical protein [Acholeplasmataceae bacterium]